MSMMRRVLWNKFKSPFTDTGTSSRKDRGNNSLSSKLSVNEEYSKAFRSNSYEEMWGRVQGQLGLTTSTSPSSRLSSLLSSSSSSSPFYLDLSEYLLEPREETLKSMMESLNFHHLLIEYFDASLRACHICELLLRSIHQTRSDYRKIKKVIKISKRVLILHDCSSNIEDHTDQYYCRAIFRELTSIALLRNPLTIISPLQHRDIRESYLVLLHKLTSKQKKIKRREKLRKICKKVGGVGLVISHSLLSVALLVFALHGVFGLVAAPAVMGCSSIYLGKRKNLASSARKRVGSERVGSGRVTGGGLSEQLDVAAKAVFILINDFDTMSQMVRRLQNEVEHRKSVAGICVRNKKFELLREVVREFHEQDSSFVEQLEELEGHIHLCLLTINRSRRLVVQEIIASQ
ncbi:hypothetical protein PanWU01x14_059300 [Parasponia andersonii]|uniref:Transmembrane protein n=1 Tax=Parasponia andersonii TaxID=3476 RepID=A0A2P5DJH8_PARAD|nr:hypothetical protein PanWU01x14_059300 [Parasponia andersonii]